MRLHDPSGAGSHGPGRGRPNNDRAPLSSQLNDRVPVNSDHIQHWAVKNQADAVPICVSFLSRGIRSS